MSLPARDQVLPAREPSPRWPARASSQASRIAQFSTSSLVIDASFGRKSSACGPFCGQMRSMDVLFGPFWYPIYAGKGHKREKTQPRKPLHMRGVYLKMGPNHFSQTAEIIDMSSFTKYTG